MKFNWSKVLTARAVLGVMLLVGLLAFDIFNFDTTRFALSYFFEGAQFFGIPWSVIVAIAATSVDLAGIAKIFTPEQGLKNEDVWVWVLLAVWFITAVINATGTWWAMVLLLSEHQTMGNLLVSQMELLTWVPVILALFILTVRVGLIGSISMAGDRWLWGASETAQSHSKARIPNKRSTLPPLHKPAPSAAPVPVKAMAPVPSTNGKGEVDDFLAAFGGKE